MGHARIKSEYANKYRTEVLVGDIVDVNPDSTGVWHCRMVLENGEERVVPLAHLFELVHHAGGPNPIVKNVDLLLDARNRGFRR